MKKYKNKYRIASARAQWWDYGANALYFVTICCHNRVCWFGNVINGEMMLSKIGEMAESEWLKTFDMRPDMNLWMGEYKFGPQSKNLASIIRGFKIGVTQNARKINPDFQWQARYHDHIIRDEKSFINISNYIENNPKKWDTDKFHA